MDTGNVRGFAEQYKDAEGYRTTEIGGRKYTIRLLSAYTAFVTGMQLVKTFLPALGGLLDGEGRKDLVLPEDDALFTETAMLLVNQMDRVDLVDVIQHLVKDAQCEGATISVDSHFRGNISGFISLIEFALRENFSDFFTGFLKEKGLGLQSLRARLPQAIGNEE